MASPKPTVSLVIPAFNEEGVILQCLEAALRQTVPAHEIIVVDNLSEDATAALVRRFRDGHPDAPVVLAAQDREQGLVPTRNLGLGMATGDVLGRIDADTLLEPDWVEQVCAAFADPELMGATGPVHYYDMPLRRLGRAGDAALRRLVYRAVFRRCPPLLGCNMALRRAAWEAVSGEVCRDEADRMHEDVDVSVHLAARGLRVRLVPGMVAGMSARRLEDSPRDYSRYVGRWHRTYKAHGMGHPALRLPMLLFGTLYYPGRMLRLMHAVRSPHPLRRGGVEIGPVDEAGDPSLEGRHAAEVRGCGKRKTSRTRWSGTFIRWRQGDSNP